MVEVTAATCMPLQVLFLDKMMDNDTEHIALNSNDDDIFGGFKISEFGIALLSCYSSLFKTSLLSCYSSLFMQICFFGDLALNFFYKANIIFHLCKVRAI